MVTSFVAYADLAGELENTDDDAKTKITNKATEANLQMQTDFEGSFASLPTSGDDFNQIKECAIYYGCWGYYLSIGDERANGYEKRYLQKKTTIISNQERQPSVDTSSKVLFKTAGNQSII